MLLKSISARSSARDHEIGKAALGLIPLLVEEGGELI
jgi:hypothetical protein